MVQALAVHPDGARAETPVAAPSDPAHEAFLDRLMMAESGGRDGARNARSSAFGAFQFINATFLDVVRRYFADETKHLTPPQILALRTDRVFARRAADAYSRDNASHLKAAGLPVTYPALRLAFLLGPSGAERVLKAPADQRVATLFGPAVINANPFMFGLSAAGLIARAAREVMSVGPVDQAVAGTLAAAVRPATKPLRPLIDIRCNPVLPSCRRWIELQTRIVENRVASRSPATDAAGRAVAR